MVDKANLERPGVNCENTLGRRLRQARQGRGWTLNELAEAMDRPITRQALSKFERGAARPKPTVLRSLASALDVRPSWLLTEPQVHVEWLGYRKHSRLTKTARDAIEAQATIRAEAELTVRSLLDHEPVAALPSFEVHTLPLAESAAARLRQAWSLGTDAIASLVEVLERHGAVVILVGGHGGFDGLSGLADGAPVIVLNRDRPVDRLRFNLAHELGHLVLQSQDVDDEETLANRFAGALLAPEPAVKQSFGNRRTSVSIPELALMKRKWGLSMQAAARRAFDLGIIGPGAYRQLSIEFSRRGWRLDEPGICPFEEEPVRFRSQLWHALSADLLTRDEASRLLPGFLRFSEAEFSPEKRSLREIASMSREERAEFLRTADIASDEFDEWDATDAAELRALGR